MGSATCLSERPGGTVLGVGAPDTLTYPLAGHSHSPVPTGAFWTLSFLAGDTGLRTAPVSRTSHGLEGPGLLTSTPEASLGPYSAKSG